MRMDTVKKKLGYTVRSERERLGLSQSSLAERAGVSTRTISDIETCNGNPELATLIPLTQYLRISIDSVVQEDEADTTTYQIMKELQTCSEDDRQIALRILRELLSALKEKGGVALLTADHGNADCMIAEDGTPFTAHTTAPVPLVLINYSDKDLALKDEHGSLSNISPTLLEMIGIKAPKEMTAESLLVKA